MIIAHGFPKSGTNLVKKALGGLGLEEQEGLLIQHNIHEPLRLSKAPENMTPARAFAMSDDYFIHGHIADPLSVPRFVKVVNIVRHPKNATLSFLRWAENREKGLRYCREHLVFLIKKGAYTYGPWLGAMFAFQAWQPHSLTIRFEDICSDNCATVARIANYTKAGSVGQIKHVYDRLYGNGKYIDDKPAYQSKDTWTGEWSDYRKCDFWDGGIEDLWAERGGRELCDLMGYR